MSGMRRETEQRYEKIAELFKQGKSRREICEELHYTRQTIDRVVRLYGLAPEQGTFEEHREEIIGMRRSGMTYQEIAEKTGLSESTISRNLRHMSIKQDKSGRRKERKQEIFRARTEDLEEDLKPERYADDTKQIRHIEVKGKQYQDVSDWFM